MIQQFHFCVDTQKNWKHRHKYLHTNVPNSVTHNSQKVGNPTIHRYLCQTTVSQKK